MASKTVDVLAVMEDASELLGREGFSAIPNDLLEARDATAYAIEALRLIAEATAPTSFGVLNESWVHHLANAARRRAQGGA